jgi:predicted nuclease of predicted toxin-antitoxin system
MNILLDHNLHGRLAEHLPEHTVQTTKEMGWQRYANGKLLEAAQESFDLLLTTDVSLYSQQKIEQYDIAVIVLRAFNNKLGSLTPLLSEVLELVPDIQPGQVQFIYADERLRASDQRRKRGPYARR